MDVPVSTFYMWYLISCHIPSPTPVRHSQTVREFLELLQTQIKVPTACRSTGVAADSTADTLFAFTNNQPVYPKVNLVRHIQSTHIFLF